jgi:hypothetical protein
VFSMMLGLLRAAGQQEELSPPLRFTVFSARPVADMAFLPRVDAMQEKLEFYPTARSPRYEYRGPMPLQFFGAGGEVAAEAAVPHEMRDVLLLFIPIVATPAQTALRHRVAIIDDSPARSGPRGLVIIDLSGLPLSGMANQERVTLMPGLNPALAVGASVRIKLATEFKGRSYQAYANAFELGPDERALLILFPPFYRGSLEVQSRLLRDEVPRKAD